jgi:hypothetical protein
LHEILLRWLADQDDMEEFLKEEACGLAKSEAAGFLSNSSVLSS